MFRHLLKTSKTSSSCCKKRLLKSPAVAAHFQDDVRHIRFLTPHRTLSTKSAEDRLTVVLDMDETLIHSVFQQDGGEDDETYRQSEIRQSARVEKGTESFEISLDDGTVTVILRPGVQDFLIEAAKLYNIYIFTAATQDYADLVLNHLDPQNEIFVDRFYRPQCTRTRQNYFIKDLSKISDDLSRVVLVDNNPICFAPQPKNGIWVPSFYDDPSDDILMKTLPNFLRDLDDTKDVRQVLEKLTIEQLSNIQDDKNSRGIFPVYRLEEGGVRIHSRM